MPGQAKLSPRGACVEKTLKPDSSRNRITLSTWENPLNPISCLLGEQERNTPVLFFIIQLSVVPRTGAFSAVCSTYSLKQRKGGGGVCRGSALARYQPGGMIRCGRTLLPSLLSQTSHGQHCTYRQVRLETFPPRTLQNPPPQTRGTSQLAGLGALPGT